MSIRAKIILSLSTTLLFFTFAALYTFYRTEASMKQLDAVAVYQLPLARELDALANLLTSIESDFKRRLFPTPFSPSTPFARMAREFYPYVIERKFVELEKKIEERALSSRISNLRESFQQILDGSDREAFQTSYKNLVEELRSIATQVHSAGIGALKATGAENSRYAWIALVASLSVVLFGIFAILFSNRTLSPLPSLIQSVRKIAEGDFQQSLKVSTKDAGEVAGLAREYNRMLQALKDRDLRIQNQQAELVKSERLAAVGQLSSEIVHEIRNPLNAINLNIDWLQDQIGGMRTEIKEVLTSVSKEIERLFQITEGYLVRARLPGASENKVALNEMIRELVAFTHEEARSNSISVEEQLSRQELYIRGDKARLKQAFINLFKNAKEAMPMGGTLRVSTDVGHNVYKVRLTDTGYGMNESVRRNVFEPFFTTKPGGTGLGLMLTKSIVEEAHGTIQCESQLGEGTTFTIQFPV